ncbi:MAG: hypothetical protein OIN86_16840 [Candidatus Methanoperedens sp.]|nr:hypothetical protein [Candidatus Methanoperedens sp.]
MVNTKNSRVNALLTRIVLTMIAILFIAGSGYAETTLWNESQGSPVPFTWNVTNGENLTGTDFGNNLPLTPQTNVTIAVRIIGKESLRFGESTNITVDISSNMSQALSFHEIIPAGWNLTRISDDADAFKNSTRESIWFNVSPGINKTVIYRLTAPDNASIGTYHINGAISSASGVIAVVQGDNTITLDIKAFYRRLGSDTDRVEATDVLTAAEDWRNNIAPAGFERAIKKQELFVLIDEWIGPIATPTPDPAPVPTLTPSPTYVVTPGITPYLLVKVGTIPYYIELIKTGSGRIEEPKIPADPNLKVVFYVDGVLYRTETIARYCLFDGDICAPSKLPANGEHVIEAKIYNKTTGVWLDTQSMIINQ